MIFPRRALAPPSRRLLILQAIAVGVVGLLAFLALSQQQANRVDGDQLSLAVPADREAALRATRAMLTEISLDAKITAVDDDRVRRLAGVLGAGEEQSLPVILDVTLTAATAEDREKIDDLLADTMPGTIARWATTPATGLPLGQYTNGWLLFGLGAAVAVGAAIFAGRSWVLRNRTLVGIARLHGGSRADVRRGFRRTSLWWYAAVGVAGGGLAAAVAAVGSRALPTVFPIELAAEAVSLAAVSLVAVLIVAFVAHELTVAAMLHGVYRRDELRQRSVAR